MHPSISLVRLAPRLQAVEARRTQSTVAKHYTQLNSICMLSDTIVHVMSIWVEECVKLTAS